MLKLLKTCELFEACTNGDLKEIRYLVEHGADVNAKNNFGQTPLHRACRSGHFEMVNLFNKKK